MAETAAESPHLAAVPDDDDVVEVLALGFESEELGKPSPLEDAVVGTLTELQAEGRLRPRDAGKVALALDLTRVMAIKRRSGRTSTYSNDARLLYDILDGFEPETAGADEVIKAKMAEWSAELERLAATRGLPAASS